MAGRGVRHRDPRHWPRHMVLDLADPFQSGRLMGSSDEERSAHVTAKGTSDFFSFQHTLGVDNTFSLAAAAITIANPL